VVQFSYSVSGNPARPWLTLCHPIGSSKQIWEALAERLGVHYRVLSYDIRGHGQSPAVPGEVAMDDLAGDCEAIWNALGIEQSVFVGLSLGGCIGLALAHRAPHRVTALTVACARLAMDVQASNMWRERADAVQTQGMAPVVEATLDRWLTEPWRQGHSEQVQAIRATLAATTPMGFAQCARALANGQPLSRLAGLRLPVQFIAGREDKAVPAAHLLGYAQQTPGARFAELPGPHLLHVESETAFYEAVTQFLGSASA